MPKPLKFTEVKTFGELMLYLGTFIFSVMFFGTLFLSAIYAFVYVVVRAVRMAW